MSRYRENKYGEKVEVESRTCGSCKNYMFEREDDTNKCDHFGKYYTIDDSCRNNWEEY